MKTIFLLFFLAQSIGTEAQNYDSLISIIYHATTDSARIRRIYDVIENNGWINPKDVIYYHKKILEETKKNKDKIGEAVITAELGWNIAIMGDIANGTKMIYDALRMAEETGNQQAIGIAYHDLAFIYYGSDPDKAIQYYKKGLVASQAGHDDGFACAATYHLGAVFMQKNQLDSAMNFIQRAYELSITNKVEIMLPEILIGLSNLHLLMGKRRLALEYLHTALEASFTKKNDVSRGYVYNEIGKFYESEGNFDSSLYYGNKAFETVQNESFVFILGAADFLRNLYKNRNSDSALKYTNIYYSAKDSVFSTKQVQQLQVFAFEEEKRQQLKEEEKIKAKENRKHNIQYAAIAIGIITFIILFVLLSRSIIVSTKFLEFWGVTGLLVMFEFINLIIHPYLAHATNDSPVLMLLVLVAIAALLVPLHHKLQKWVNMKMVEKNKKIRLAAAKRTIAKLEGETGSKEL